MKFSWKWLNELVDLNNIPLKDIIDKLTLAGFEIEDIENKPEIEDTIININITANRSDVASLVGLAREISVIFDVNLNKKFIYHSQTNIENEFKSSKSVSSEILTDLQVDIIQLLEQNISPQWLKNYLQGCGVSSNNILHDIHEYIKLKWGQDIEIFDIGAITNSYDYSNLIEFEQNYNNSKKLRKLMDLNSYHNIPKLEVLKYNQNILSIFGITSNHKFACNTKSKNLIIVGHICKLTYIKNIFFKIQQKTTKINQHLNNINRNDFYHAYNECIKLILNLNKGEIKQSYKYQHANNTNKIIKIDLNNIIRILGPCQQSYQSTKLSKIVKDTLTKLQFKTSHKDNHLLVNIPNHRQEDIKREIDVIEEIARIYGFDKFIDKLPSYNSIGNTPSITTLVRKIRYILRNIGLHEVIHYSLDNQNKHKNINIYNPLLTDQSKLKNSLSQQLINTYKYNKKQKNIFFESFEIGKIFYTDKNYSTCIETIHLAGIMGNPKFTKKEWNEKNYELTWFQAKGLMEDFFEKLHADICWAKLHQNTHSEITDLLGDICHPYRTAILYNSNMTQEIGIFGEVNRRLQDYLNCSYKTYIFEINLHKLMNTINHYTHLQYNAKSYSLYPSVTRDISLIVSHHESTEYIKQKIFQQSKTCIESIEVFNEYTKNEASNHNRYVGFRITYRLHNRTLNDKDIHNIDQEIKNLISN